MQLYGIKNCDTVKKARRWLENNGIDYHFHDFRADGLELQQVEQWLKSVAWEALLNKRGTTWRKLEEAVKDSVTSNNIARLLVEQPTLIKRPVLVLNEAIEIGYSETRYSELLNA